MSSKNKTEVLIDGKIYTLSGYESEENLQRVATYINNKLAELKKLDGYARLSQELKSILLELNVADDYFKAKNQVEMVEEELAQKDQELYDLKHELISTQIKLEDAAKELEALKEQRLGGIVLLGRDAKDNRFEIMTPAERVLRVMQRMISPSWTDELVSRSLAFAETLTDEIPVFHFLCMKNPSAAHKMRQRIDLWEAVKQ